MIVTAGLGEALTLLATLLLDPGDAVWLEEPGYPLAARLLARENIPSRRFRLMNEVPTLVLVAVVLLAVFKPF